VTPGEQILGMTPFDKGAWIGRAAAAAGTSATARDVFEQWKRKVYAEATARFGDPRPFLSPVETGVQSDVCTV
jgi:hypothetical protein